MGLVFFFLVLFHISDGTVGVGRGEGLFMRTLYNRQSTLFKKDTFGTGIKFPF